MKIVKCIDRGGANSLVVGQYYNVLAEDSQHFTIDNFNGGWYKERFTTIYDDGQPLVQNLATLSEEKQPWVCIAAREPVLVKNKVYFLANERHDGSDVLVDAFELGGKKVGAGWLKNRFQRVGAPLNSENNQSDKMQNAYTVMSEILKGHKYSVSQMNIDHLNRIDSDMLAYLASSWNDFDRVANDAEYWTLQNRHNKEQKFQIPNPIHRALLRSNSDAKQDMTRGIRDYITNPPAKGQEMATVSTASVRKKVAMEAVRQLPNAQSYAFGGFVRDYIAGDDFGDVDIVLNGAYCRSDFLGNLKSAGIKAIFMEKRNNYGDKNEHEIYAIVKDGVEIMLDIVVGENGNLISDPIAPNKWDADINKVFMRKDGSMGAGFGYSGTFNALQEKIKSKEYLGLSGLTNERRDKLVAKGYYTTGALRPIPKTSDMKENIQMEKSVLQQTPVLTKPSFMDKFKVNAEDAAYRVAATQMTTGTKAAILAMMEKQGQGSERIAAIAEMLDTEVGSALVAGLLGLGLAYAPMVSEDPRAQRLADEFQVTGMATVGNAVVGIAMEHFLPVVTGALASLPQPTQRARVAGHTEEAKAILAPAIELEDNSVKAPAAANAAR